jgi:hypothetical protein
VAGCRIAEMLNLCAHFRNRYSFNIAGFHNNVIVALPRPSYLRSQESVLVQFDFHKGFTPSPSCALNCNHAEAQSGDRNAKPIMNF